MDRNAITTVAIDPRLLPITERSLCYVIRLHDESLLRIVVSSNTTVASVVEFIAFRFTDCPLLNECQLLRDGFPVPKSARMCSLPVGSGSLSFAMAYADPQRLTEHVVDAIVQHAYTTRSGSPRKNWRLGDGNLYEVGCSSPLSYVVDRADPYYESSKGETRGATSVRYKAERGFETVHEGLVKSVVDRRPFFVTVHLVSAGVRELRRIGVQASTPVAVLRDELFPTPESSRFFRLYCDDFPVLNESASFSELLISSMNVLEFRVDIDSGAHAVPDIYQGSVTGRKVPASRAPEGSFRTHVDLLTNADALYRGASTSRRLLAESEPALSRVGAVVRGAPVDANTAAENDLRHLTKERARRLRQLSVLAEDAVRAAEDVRANHTYLAEDHEYPNDAMSPEPRSSHELKKDDHNICGTSSDFSRGRLMYRSPPRTRTRSPPATRTRRLPDSRPHDQDLPCYSISNVGEAATTGPVFKVYDPARQVPIVFVDPDDPSYLHQLNVYGANLVSRLRKYSNCSSGIDILCDGTVVVPGSDTFSDLTFWDVTRGVPGKVFSLRIQP